MKSLQFAVLLLLSVSFAAALRCQCVYMIGLNPYFNTTQTCHGSDSVCVSITGVVPAYRSPINFKRCMKSSHAIGLKDIDGLHVQICDTDFCNKK